MSLARKHKAAREKCEKLESNLKAQREAFEEQKRLIQETDTDLAAKVEEAAALEKECVASAKAVWGTKAPTAPAEMPLFPSWEDMASKDVEASAFSQTEAGKRLAKVFAAAAAEHFEKSKAFFAQQAAARVAVDEPPAAGAANAADKDRRRARGDGGEGLQTQPMELDEASSDDVDAFLAAAQGGDKQALQKLFADRGFKKMRLG